MSKTPIKAALERLELEGYITVSPQSGITVRELSDSEVAELFEVRVALEGYVLRTVTGQLTAEQFAEWDANLSALAAIAGQAEKRQQVVELDTEFHALPSKFLGNQEIIRLMRQYSQKIRLVTFSVFSMLPNRAPQSLIEHREILEAVRSGNGQLASELMEKHIRLGQKLLSKARLR